MVTKTPSFTITQNGLKKKLSNTMALDDFTSEDGSGSKGIKTRKKLKNVTLPLEFWENWMIAYPSFASSAAMYGEENAAKAIVQRLDKIIEEGAQGHTISDEKYEELQQERDRIVEEVL